MSTTEQIEICVFMKPARPGESKTRLASAIGAASAATLAQCFFDDIWESLASLEWAHPIVACTEAVDFGDARDVWMQGDGDLGKRQETILKRALRDSPAALIIGADIPGLPLRFLESARAALANSDAVLGPSDDGGFYLIGLKRCPDGLFSDIGWSQSDTFSQTLSRLQEAHMNVSLLDSWFDVDTSSDLSRLQSLIETGTIIAPHTAAALLNSEILRS